MRIRDSPGGGRATCSQKPARNDGETAKQFAALGPALRRVMKEPPRPSRPDVRGTQDHGLKRLVG